MIHLEGIPKGTTNGSCQSSDIEVIKCSASKDQGNVLEMSSNDATVSTGRPKAVEKYCGTCSNRNVYRTSLPAYDKSARRTVRMSTSDPMRLV